MRYDWEHLPKYSRAPGGSDEIGKLMIPSTCVVSSALRFHQCHLPSGDLIKNIHNVIGTNLTLEDKEYFCGMHKSSKKELVWKCIEDEHPVFLVMDGSTGYICKLWQKILSHIVCFEHEWIVTL